MGTVIGVISLSFVLAVFSGVSLSIKSLRYPLLLGIGIRIAFVLFDFYVAPLPDHGSDVENFQIRALAWSEGGFLEMLSHFPGPTTFFYAWLLAFFYNVFEPSILLAQSLSVFMGGAIIILSWRIASSLFDNRIANMAAWFVALFPTLVLYSALPLREPFLVFFFLLAVYGTCLWSRDNSLVGAVVALGGFGLATFFHGAFAIGGLSFLGIVLLRAGRDAFSSLRRYFVKPKATALALAAPALVGVLLLGNIAIPKLGTIYEAVDPYKIISIVNYSARDGAAYPEWVQPNTPLELIVKAPIRVIYFLFSPFPWDISKPEHVIGFLDALFYLVMAAIIYRKRALLDFRVRTVIWVVAPIVLAFALAIGNFGTGVRHRAKFAPLFLIVFAYVAPRLRYKKSENIKSDIHSD